MLVYKGDVMEYNDKIDSHDIIAFLSMLVIGIVILSCSIGIGEIL